MAITNYKYLQFFDKNGDSINFDYGITGDIWTGTFYIPEVSTGLVESCQFFMMEELLPGPTAEPQYGFPHIAGATGATSAVLAYWEDSEKEEFFIYQVTGATTTAPTIEKLDNLTVDFNIDPTEYGSTGSTYSGMKVTSVINNSAVQISVGFLPEIEGTSSRVLLLEDVDRGVVFAKIKFYGVSVGEDERLSVLLDNLGDNINDNDFKIFDSTDINEELTDFVKMNNKRKELCLEFHNIFNTVGSYKSLINAIKYFGYDQLTVKEYWKNVDVDSKEFGKYRHVDIKDLFTDNPNYNTSKSLIPSKYYKKTSKFGLFFDITRETGSYDADGIPIVEETFLFTIEEVLIKLYALKNKLKNEFLPTSARIVDIVGELLVFAKYDINLWNDQSRIDSVDLNLLPKVSASPSTFGYISDLRPLQSAGCPIAPDLTVGGTQNLKVYNYTISGADEGDVWKVTDTVTNNYITYETGEDENDYETVVGLVNAWNSSVNYPFINFEVYAFGATSSGIIRVVEQYETTFDFNISVVQGPVGGSPTFTSSELFLGATAMQNYADCFLGYFQRWQVPITELNDDADIPVGYPVVLSNDTFNITWDDALLTWNSLDQINTDPGSSGYLNALYGPWITSFTITGATVGSVLETASILGFPDSKYVPVNRSDGSWDWITIERCNFYEMQWIITCTESDTVGASGWIYDTGTLSIDDLETHALVLPYVGKYRLEMNMWDLFNGRTHLKTDNYFEVDIKNSDMIGWYTQKELKYTWDDKEIERTRTQEYLPGEITPRPQQIISDPRKRLNSKEYLNWDDYASSWDLPLQPNEELNMAEMTWEFLDKVEFYNKIRTDMEPIPELVDLKSYTWDNAASLNLKESSEYTRWKDLDGIWWNSTGPKLTRFEFNQLGSTGPTIKMTNKTRNRESSFEFADLGSTGSTGLISAVYQLNNFAGASAINTNLLTGSTAKNVDNLFDNFIFYYGERYDDIFGATTHAHSLIPYVYAISKDPDVRLRYDIDYVGITGENYTYYTANFGTIGDTPLGFEIYSVVSGPTGTIKIGSELPYVIGATTTTLIELASELNGATANGIKDYTYNIVIGQTGGTHFAGGTGTLTGTTGATSLSRASKIIAVKDSYNSYDSENYSYGGGISATTYGRSVTSNISWDELRPLKYHSILDRWSQVNFSYTNGGMSGKKNPVWELIRENDNDWVNIYYKGDYFAYLFNKSGSYTINLSLEDTNGNKKTITKKELIKIK